MLSRVLEPEVMDSHEEALDYDSMDHGQVNRAFVDDFLKCFDGQRFPDSVLDLGTGTALIPIELCRRVPEASVVAVDLAESMLDLARANVVLAGLFDRIALERVDSKRLLFPAGRFAATISNSIVHHVPEPRQVLVEAARVTAPGGWIFFRDLLRPETDEMVDKLVELYAGDATSRQRELFDASLRAALSLDEIRALVGELGYRPDTVRQSSDRHWTFAAQKSGN